MNTQQTNHSNDEKTLYEIRPALALVLYWALLDAQRYLSFLIVLAIIFNFTSTSITVYNTISYIASLFPLLVIILPITTGFLKYLKTRYWITNKGIIIKTGLLGYKITKIPFHRISDVTKSQTLLERILSISSIRIQSLAGQASANTAGAEANLQGLTDQEADKLLKVISSFLNSAVVKL